MNEDDRNSRGVATCNLEGGRRSGMKRKTDHNGGGGDDTGERVTVRLVCRHCREVRVISVPARRNVPGEILWECFSCQHNRSSSGGDPDPDPPST